MKLFGWPSLRRLILLPLAGVALVVFACGGGGASQPESGARGGDATPVEDGEVATIALPARWRLDDAQSLDTLVASADVVFRGTVVSLKGQHPVLQPTGSAPEAVPPRWGGTPVSQFEVRVESVMSGNLTPGATVILEQLGGVETRPDGTRVRIMLEGDAPIEVGQAYLIFATFQDDGSIVASPFGRMKVQGDGSLVAEQGWEHLGALVELSQKEVGDAEQEISAAAGD